MNFVRKLLALPSENKLKGDNCARRTCTHDVNAAAVESRARLYISLRQAVRYRAKGVSDMFVHQDTQPAQRFGDFGNLTKRTNVDAGADRDMFERTSPTLQAKKIRVPVMHAYVGEDRNVGIASGEAVKRVFERAGHTVDYTLVEDEVHGYREDANVFMSYNKFDAFMKRHLPTK